MSTTTDLGLIKPSGTDFINIEDINGNMDKISKAIADKANKTDIPTKLPANGGNADTVDGFNAYQLQCLQNTGVPYGDMWIESKWNGTYFDTYAQPMNGDKLKVSVSNADTVDGKHSSDFLPRNWTKITEQDIIAYAINTLPDNSFTVIDCYNGTNVPSGYSTTSNDFMHYINKISSAWIQFLSIDVRSNRTFRARVHGGVINTWTEVCDGGNAAKVNGIKVSVQSATPSSPSTGDLWIW